MRQTRRITLAIRGRTLFGCENGTVANNLINNLTVGRVVVSLNRLLGLEIAMIGLTVTEKDLEGLPNELLSQLKMTTSQPQKTLQKDLEVSYQIILQRA